MEVRPARKKTEVGMVPEDWDAVPLGDLGKFKNGINKSSESFGHGSPFVNLMDVFGRSRIVSTQALGLVATNTAEQQTFDLRKGDVVFIRSSVKPSGVGLTAVIENDLPGTVYSGFLIRYRDNGRLSDSFKRHCFYEAGFRRRLIGSSSVSANTNINQDNLKRLALILPRTTTEQDAVAEALSDADALIESLGQLLTKKRQLKQGAMQELLTGKKRLPGFESRPAYKQTEVGVIPEDWAVVPLGQRLRRAPSYGVNAPAIAFDSRFPTYLRITDITEDGGFAEATKVSVDHHASGEYSLEPGDIVLARTGASVGKSYLYRPIDGPLVFAGFLIRVSPDVEKLVPAFLFYFSHSRLYWNWVRANSMRSGQPGLNGDLTDGNTPRSQCLSRLRRPNNKLSPPSSPTWTLRSPR